MSIKTAIIGGISTGLALTAILIAVDQFVIPLVPREHQTPQDRLRDTRTGE